MLYESSLQVSVLSPTGTRRRGESDSECYLLLPVSALSPILQRRALVKMMSALGGEGKRETSMPSPRQYDRSPKGGLFMV